LREGLPGHCLQTVYTKYLQIFAAQVSQQVAAYREQIDIWKNHSDYAYGFKELVQETLMKEVVPVLPSVPALLRSKAPQGSTSMLLPWSKQWNKLAYNFCKYARTVACLATINLNGKIPFWQALGPSLLQFLTYYQEPPEDIAGQKTWRIFEECVSSSFLGKTKVQASQGIPEALAILDFVCRGANKSDSRHPEKSGNHDILRDYVKYLATSKTGENTEQGAHVVDLALPKTYIGEYESFLTLWIPKCFENCGTTYGVYIQCLKRLYGAVYAEDCTKAYKEMCCPLYAHLKAPEKFMLDPQFVVPRLATGAGEEEKAGAGATEGEGEEEEEEAGAGAGAGAGEEEKAVHEGVFEEMGAGTGLGVGVGVDTTEAENFLGNYLHNRVVSPTIQAASKTVTRPSTQLYFAPDISTTIPHNGHVDRAFYLYKQVKPGQDLSEYEAITGFIEFNIFSNDHVFACCADGLLFSKAFAQMLQKSGAWEVEHGSYCDFFSTTKNKTVVVFCTDEFANKECFRKLFFEHGPEFVVFVCNAIPEPILIETYTSQKIAKKQYGACEDLRSFMAKETETNNTISTLSLKISKSRAWLLIGEPVVEETANSSYPYSIGTQIPRPRIIRNHTPQSATGGPRQQQRGRPGVKTREQQLQMSAGV
jgi:hypothetical protein